MPTTYPPHRVVLRARYSYRWNAVTFSAYRRSDHGIGPQAVRHADGYNRGHNRASRPCRADIEIVPWCRTLEQLRRNARFPSVSPQNQLLCVVPPDHTSGAEWCRRCTAWTRSPGSDRTLPDAAESVPRAGQPAWQIYLPAAPAVAPMADQS